MKKFNELYESIITKEILTESLVKYKTKFDIDNGQSVGEAIINVNDKNIKTLKIEIGVDSGFNGNYSFHINDRIEIISNDSILKNILSFVGLYKKIKINPQLVPIKILINAYCSILHAAIVESQIYKMITSYQFNYDNTVISDKIVLAFLKQFEKKYLADEIWTINAKNGKAYLASHGRVDQKDIN